MDPFIVLVDSAGYWASVNDIVRHFAGVSWVPNHFAALLAAHKIDAQALIELTDDDLRETFYITSEEMCEAILNYIFESCVRCFPDAFDGELQQDGDRFDGDDDPNSAPGNCSKMITQNESNGAADESAAPLNIDDSDEPPFEFNFVEDALAPLRQEWEAERAAQIAASKAAKRNASRLPKFSVSATR